MNIDMSNFLNIRIRAIQEVSYDQTVKMRRDDWERIKGMPKKDQYRALESRIDQSDVSDWDNIENIEASVVDGDGDDVDGEDGVDIF